MNLKIVIAIIISCVVVNISYADCQLAHTHIGVNPTLRPDWSDPGNASLDTDPVSTDDDKLWFFSLPPVHAAGTPGWPNWEQDNGDVFLQLVPVLDGGNLVTKPGDPSKQLWTCQFMYSKANGYGDPLGTQHLDGWHSAHGPRGMWSLESIDEETTPGWEIHLQREATSVASDDFFMLLPDDTPVLTTDGSDYQLNKMWLPDKNAWGIHEHMSFNFWLTPDLGQEVTATFSAYDAGGLYTASDNFEFAFVTVPEPASLLLLGLGVIPVLRNREKRCNE
jgi:hypothetical protein